jgi:hypothetical protein
MTVPLSKGHAGVYVCLLRHIFRISPPKALPETHLERLRGASSIFIDFTPVWVTSLVDFCWRLPSCPILDPWYCHLQHLQRHFFSISPKQGAPGALLGRQRGVNLSSYTSEARVRFCPIPHQFWKQVWSIFAGACTRLVAKRRLLGCYGKACDAPARLLRISRDSGIQFTGFVSISQRFLILKDQVWLKFRFRNSL